MVDTWKTLADDLLQALNNLQKSASEGKSKLEPQLAGELDTAIRTLCARIKADSDDKGGQLIPEPLV